MKAFAEAGLHCGIVYEDGARQFGYSNGVAAATYTLERCGARGQPEGTCVYYAEDYDAPVSDVNGPIAAFFHGVNDAHKKLSPTIKIGCYGSGMVTNTLLAAKLIDYRWITCSTGFNGSAKAIHSGEFELWQTHCDTHLLGIDIDYDVSRVADFGQFLPFGEPLVFEATDAAPPPAALSDSPEILLEHGKGSWYSQFNGKYRWRDSGDSPGSNALGVSDDAQGISFYNHETLGKWFQVHAPNGRVLIEQQTEIGPSPSTGRLIDVSAAAAERFGYSPDDFPTNAVFYWRPVEAPWQVAGLGPRAQAIKWRQVRSYYDTQIS